MNTLLALVLIVMVAAALFIPRKAIYNWWQASRRRAQEAVANPVEDAATAIADNERSIGEFRKAVATAMAHQKLTEGKLKLADGDAAKYQRIAEQAVAVGNDDDARRALEEKARLDKSIASFKTELARNSEVIKTQRENLRRAEARIDTAKSDKDILSVRLRGAELTKKMANASALGDEDGLDALSRKVDQTEAEASAFQEMSGEGEPSLFEKYSGAGQAIEDQLAALKAKTAR